MLTSSFATMPGKRFVMCRISRTVCGSGIARRYYGRRRRSGRSRPANDERAGRLARPPVRSFSRVLPTSSAALILPSAISFETAVSLAMIALRFGRLDAHLAEADATVLDGEERVRTTDEVALLDVPDHPEDAEVDELQRAREDVRAEEALVGVDTDAPDALLLGGRECTETAVARRLEDDIRACGDLVQRDLLALRLIDEVLGVRRRDLDALLRRLRAGLEAREVGDDGRHGLAADGADAVRLRWPSRPRRPSGTRTRSRRRGRRGGSAGRSSSRPGCSR